MRIKNFYELIHILLVTLRQYCGRWLAVPLWKAELLV